VDELSQRLGELPRDKVVVVYCHSGARSARATGVLRRAGYQARDLGPMRAW
jgi:adenylyltransferase/sulfurtransferase